MKNVAYKDYKKVFKNSIKLRLFQKGTRDSRNLKVYKDEKNGAFILDKSIVDNNYYIRKRVFEDKTLVNSVKKNFYFKQFKETIEEKNYLNKIIKKSKKKNLCDIGCSNGKNFNLLKKFAKCYGVELNKDSLKILKKKHPNILIKSKINNFSIKFDFVTLFHVFSHLRNPLYELKEIFQKIKKGGKIIIETMHAQDIISDKVVQKDYNEYRFSKEFFIIHSSKSICKFLKYIGFKNIKVSFLQRYGLANHLGWFILKKPGGHFLFKKFFSKYYDDNIYKKFLSKQQVTDTLIVTATKYN